jgi:WD40-like Beta Propeller Repeat
MSTRGVRWAQHVGVVFAVVVAASVAACGSDGTPSGFGDTPAPTGDDGGTESGIFGGTPGSTLQSLTIDPPNAAVESVDGTIVTQGFKAIGHFADGSSTPIATTVTWSANEPQIGGLAATGLYTASGAVGGVVTINAALQGKQATASLTVKLHVHENPQNVPTNVQGALEGATAKDAAVVWAYPYDGTVWPRGLLAPLLQWNGGAAPDIYLVHIKSPTFELEDFVASTNSPASRVALDAPTWQKFVDSSSGPSSVKVSRWDGTTATVIADHTWSVAPGSMRGTIYYWSNNLGRVLRIKPGAATPDDFANQAPLNDPTKFTQSSCLMTCHTVSADGSTLVSGGGVYGGSYDLIGGKPLYSLGGTWGAASGSSSSVVRWMAPALSPTGKYMLTNAQALGLTMDNDPGAGTTTAPFLGLYTTADGQPVPGSGLMGVALTTPTWSPDGKRVAYVDSGDPSTWGTVPSIAWDSPPPGDLRVMQFDETKSPMVSAPQTLVDKGTDPNKRIAWPTISPDGNWVLYSRAASADTRSGNGDLYIASTVNPNQEVRLAALDGDGYPFAAGARDLSWSFEPSFAPVASGGYIWVAFTSRRTYGNVLTDVALPVNDPNNPANNKLGTKQLWVAAIDLNPTPGKDPSHPAFHLTGQDEQNLAMRGFWALEPCKGDGLGCGSGTECCGGYCASNSGGAADAGGFVCKSQTTGCGQSGDKCNVAADCCSAGTGETCVNHVCTDPAPR